MSELSEQPGPEKPMHDFQEPPTGRARKRRAGFISFAVLGSSMLAGPQPVPVFAQACDVAGSSGSGAGASAADQTSKPASVETGQSFFEPFDRLSPSRWFVSDGWGNGDHQSCTWRRRNIRIADGVLSFKLDLEPEAKRALLEASVDAKAAVPASEAGKAAALKQAAASTDSKNGNGASADGKGPAEKPPRRYSCAEIQTRQVYGYGTYEVRMRPAIGAGTVSAFFTYIGPPIAKGKPHDEIDIEFLGKDTGEVQFNFFQDGKSAGGKLHQFGYNSASRMTDLAFVWAPDSIRWYVNGDFVFELRDTPEKPLPSEPSKIYLSLWSGQGRDMVAWLGAFDEGVLPIEASYEHVAFTRPGDPCQFPSSIVCEGAGADKAQR